MHLILNTFGTSLTVENGLFVVEHTEGKQAIPAGKIKTISLGKGIKLSSDALLLALKEEIDVQFTDRSGMPQGRLFNNKFGSIATIRRKQAEFAARPQAVKWVKDIILRKAGNQMAILLALSTDNGLTLSQINAAIERMEGVKKKIAALEAGSVEGAAPTLRGWEGQISHTYFQAVAQGLPAQYRFSSRSQHPAKDIFNCLLNYAYGILYGKVEAALIRAGIDPGIGVLHKDEYNRPAMVYDVIELFRVWADYVVINICMQEVMKEEYFAIQNGAYWLESYGKRILIQSFNDYMEEKISLYSLIRTRETHIELYAQRFAQELLQFTAADRTTGDR